MTLSPTQAAVTILIMAMVTFATRVLPFALFPGNKPTPKYITYLGRVLPYAAIGMLVIYCLKSVTLLHPPYALPELLAVGIIVVVQLWRRNSLLSIGGGTLIYMLLVQFVFA